MAVSQNCVCSVSLPTTDGPPGEALLSELGSFLSSDGWEVSTPELWRDTGWRAVATRAERCLELSLAAITSDLVLLQISPEFTPGPIGRLLRRAASASPEDVQSVAGAAHRFLTSAGHSNQRWRWDGFPSDVSAPPAPHPATDG